MSARVRIQPILFPSEHGSWSFFLEPVVLGLVVAYSPSGLWLAAAAFALFLLRNPVRVLLRMRGRAGAARRLRVATNLAVALGLLAGVALAAASREPGASILIPLVVTAPFGAIFLFLDARNEGRSLVAEHAGPVNLSAFVACIALAGGWGLREAWVLFALVLGKAVLTVLYVRAKLRVDSPEGKPMCVWTRATHAVALAASTVMWIRGSLPALVVTAFVLLALRAAEGLGRGRRALSVRQVGMVEIVLSALFVALVAVAGVA